MTQLQNSYTIFQPSEKFRKWLKCPFPQFWIQIPLGNA